MKITQPASFSSPFPCPSYLQFTYDVEKQIWPVDRGGLIGSHFKEGKHHHSLAMHQPSSLKNIPSSKDRWTQ